MSQQIGEWDRKRLIDLTYSAENAEKAINSFILAKE
jgi:hypothetical protein